MNDFMTELKQDMKEERLRRWWESNAKFVYGFIIGTILITALYTWKQDADKSHAEEFSLLLDRASAIRIDDTERTKLLNKVIQDGTPAFKTLASFSQAFALVDKGDYAMAVKTFDAIGNNTQFDQLFRDFAALRAVFVLTEHLKDDPTIEQRLTTLTATKNTWRYSALEIKAMYLLEKGKNSEALAVMKALTEDENTPRFLQYRIEKLLKAIK